MDVREKASREKRLIDANALIKQANADGAYGYVDAKQIADAPTVDAVEVVRKPVKGYDGYYEVDQFGRVFGLERIIKVNDNGINYEKPIAGKQLKQSMHTNGYKAENGYCYNGRGKQKEGVD